MSNFSQRKIVLINRKFQYKMIAKFILLNMAILLLFSTLIYLFLNSEVEANLKSAHGLVIFMLHPHISAEQFAQSRIMKKRRRF